MNGNKIVEIMLDFFCKNGVSYDKPGDSMGWIDGHFDFEELEKYIDEAMSKELNK